jgi:redox-sensitive bicupin YhaK (pirin superfamily)
VNDPFIRLMDDRIDLADRMSGGADPHAGFEIVTIVLDGVLYDRDAGGLLTAGSLQWLTTGRGVIRGEDVAVKRRVRLLELWLTLPTPDRWTMPDCQIVHAEAVPVRKLTGVDVRVYSGASGNRRSTVQNRVPVTLLEVTCAARAVVDLDLPAACSSFAYVIHGTARMGENAVLLASDQVAWFDRRDGGTLNTVQLAAGDRGARVVFCAGHPQGGRIVSSGRFIGDSGEDIQRFSADYGAGRFMRMRDVMGQRTRLAHPAASALSALL